MTTRVNWSSVETAFERNAPDLTSYLDCETGDVLVVVSGAPEDDETRRRIAASPERFVKIDPASSREQYRWMERFVASVGEAELRDRLLAAIDGKGAFRRFKDVLLTYPLDRERWFTFRSALLHWHINQWFEAKRLEPDPPPPWGEVEPPPEPAEPVVRTTPAGTGVTDVLRRQLKALIDVLPACEIHSARVFLEYLRDRGSSAFASTSAEAQVDVPGGEDPTAVDDQTDDDVAQRPLSSIKAL